TASQDGDVDIVGQRDLLGVDGEDAFSALDVRTVDDNAAVEAAGTQQRRVENIGAIGCRDEDDALIRLEAIHFDEQLVECLFALVMAAAKARAAVSADRINFVDEDDTRGVLLALLEQVADARGADADEHLDKVGPADGEKWNVRFARDGACQQRLAGSRGSHQKDAFRNAAAEFLEFLWLAEELDDLLEFVFGLVNA